jgi:mono/diheme cytochrome c family protein
MAMARPIAIFLILLLAACQGARAQETLTVSGPGGTRQFTRGELLADPRVRNITLQRDPVLGRTMTYRAVPAAALLRAAGATAEDYVQARAVDNFSVAIPARLLMSADALVAIEDPARPWPKHVKGAGTYDLGPYYLVWPQGQKVSSEYWAYRLAALVVVDNPTRRWPQLAVGADIPADSPIRSGLDRFVEVCLACHRFAGAGEGTQGPDLGKPMNPVDYFRPEMLRKLLRDPQSVRTWPDRRMPGFSPETLSDGDIDAIVAWLAYKAGHGQAGGR